MKNILRGIYRIFETIFYDEFYMNFLLRFFFLLSFFFLFVAFQIELFCPLNAIFYTCIGLMV